MMAASIHGAPLAELVDASDSKSDFRKEVPVRFWRGAPLTSSHLRLDDVLDIWTNPVTRNSEHPRVNHVLSGKMRLRVSLVFFFFANGLIVWGFQ